VVVLLTEMREQAGITQKELAARLKKHRSFVWKTEGGQRRLDLVELVRWCEACGVDPVEGFRTAFGVAEMPEDLNEDHQLVIVGASFDPATEATVYGSTFPEELDTLGLEW
jgi:transcriptional regulator with XRE-family HTH domain